MMTRLLAGLANGRRGERHHRGIRLRSATDLDQRDELRRIPEMRRNDPPGRAHLGDERTRRLSARGGEHRRWRADLVEPAEQIALQRQILGHGLDDELGRRRIREPGGRGDPPHDRLDRRALQQLVGDEIIEAGADPLQGALEAVAGAAHQHHLLAGHREQLGNAMADNAIADHRERLEARWDLQFSH